jgi:hypothetical protein
VVTENGLSDCGIWRGGEVVKENQFKLCCLPEISKELFLVFDTGCFNAHWSEHV